MKIVQDRSWIAGTAFTVLAAGCGFAQDTPDHEQADIAEQASSSNPNFGVWCQEDYQFNWLPTLPYSWNRCQGMVDQMSQTTPDLFYWNLHGAKPFLETPSDQVWTEAVDLAFVNTHGGAWANTAGYAMWNFNTNAFTTSMKLGDEARGTSILSTYACETLKDDGMLPLRWAPTFNGGLRIVTGSFHTVWAGWTTDDVGADYAADLQDGDTISAAWKDGASDWWYPADLAAAATGTTKANCFSRLDGMTFQNFSAFPQLHANNIGFFCRRFWAT